MNDSNQRGFRDWIKRREGFCVYAFLLLLGFIVIWYGSKSAPRYHWMYAPDANIYLTMGQAWLAEGLYPYASLFDHKGPLVFLLYGFASIVHPGGYIGLYIMESLTLGATLAIWYKTALLLLGRHRWRIALYSVGLMVVAIGSKALLPRLSGSFAIMSQGGEAELYILLFESLSIFALCRSRGADSARWPFLAGAMLGCIGLIKFNLVVYFPFIAIAVWVSEDVFSWKKALRSLSLQLAGFLSVIAVCVSVFMLHGDGASLWNVYIVYNARYGASLAGLFVLFGSLFMRSTAFMVCGAIGAAAFGWFLRGRCDRRGWACMGLVVLSFEVSVLMMCGIQIVPSYIYYLIPLLPYVFFCSLLFFRGLCGSSRGSALEYALLAMVALLCIRDASPVRDEYIHEDATIRELAGHVTRHARGKPVRLLCYGCMDCGIYRALRMTPPVFYYMHPNDFWQPNRNAPGSIGYEQDGYIAKGQVDYVLMSAPTHYTPETESELKNPRSVKLMEKWVERGEWELLGSSPVDGADLEWRIYARRIQP